MQRPCWRLVGECDPVVMTKGYDYSAPDSIERLNSNSLPTFEPNLDCTSVHPDRQVTDFIDWSSIPNFGYIVSGRLRSILESFHLPTHCFFPLSLTHDGEQIAGYSWLHLPHPDIEIPYDATAEYAESLIMQSDLADVDLLRLYHPKCFAYCFVTDRLKNAIEDADITGLRFANPRLFRRLPIGSSSQTNVASAPWRKEQRRKTPKQFLRFVEFCESEPGMRNEIPWEWFLSVGPDEIDEMLTACPAATLERLRKQVLSAPRTDDAWDAARFLWFTGRNDVEVKQAWRTVVELLRPRFDHEI